MGSVIDYQLLGLAIILLLSVLASKVSDLGSSGLTSRGCGSLGSPLVLFLALGMLAGSEVRAGVYFDEAADAQYLGAGGALAAHNSILPVGESPTAARVQLAA